MSDLPRMAHRGVMPVDVEEGKTYAWCACGLSKTQPLCDGSHKGTAYEPQVFTADITATIFLCGCKHSNYGRFCDGTHNELP